MDKKKDGVQRICLIGGLACAAVFLFGVMNGGSFGGLGGSQGVVQGGGQSEAVPVYASTGGFYSDGNLNTPRRELVIDLPEDSGKWNLMIVYSSDEYRESAADRQLRSAFAAEPRLRSLISQVNTYTYSPSSQLWRTKIAPKYGTVLPQIVLQDNAGKVYYKASGSNIPVDPVQLGDEIQDVIPAAGTSSGSSGGVYAGPQTGQQVGRSVGQQVSQYAGQSAGQIADCRPAPRPRPSPTPTPGPQPVTPVIPDIRPAPPAQPATPVPAKDENPIPPLAWPLAGAVVLLAGAYVEWKRSK